MKQIKIIDLFAGPGGLGEGFSAYKDSKGNHPFKIALAIEKESSAHQTLTLRAFYRQFTERHAPKEYYQFLRGEICLEKLYDTYPKQALNANREARCLALGEDNNKIDQALADVLRPNEDCILIGGPPCQAYSLVGRSRRKGMEDYSPEADPRNYLYKEYLRVLRKRKPIAFVMENVKGMLSANVDGNKVFNRILDDLTYPMGKNKSIQYRIISFITNQEEETRDPRDFIVRMEQFGIPQARHRVILLGLRNDIADSWNEINVLQSSEQVSIGQILRGLPPLRSGLSKEMDSIDTWKEAVCSFPSKALAEIRKKNGDTIASEIEVALKKIEGSSLARGSNASPNNLTGTLYKHLPETMKDWYRDPSDELLLCNHDTRGHMRSDLHRYLFCSAWGKIAEKERLKVPFPRPENYPRQLIPNHANFKSGNFSDRYRVQLKNRYGTTVTSHISKDGHYFIHYDPAQCRSLSVREAARIQTFPDNYFFLGNRTQQYVQVGNAVPPYFAYKIAEMVSNFLTKKIR